MYFELITYLNVFKLHFIFQNQTIIYEHTNNKLQNSIKQITLVTANLTNLIHYTQNI